MPQIELLDPTGQPRTTQAALAPRAGSLRGLRVGLLDNGKANADVVLQRVAERLRRAHGVAAFVERRKETSTRGATCLSELARTVPVVVTALGD
jgi:hypothetical protein